MLDVVVVAGFPREKPPPVDPAEPVPVFVVVEPPNENAGFDAPPKENPEPPVVAPAVCPNMYAALLWRPSTPGAANQGNNPCHPDCLLLLFRSTLAFHYKKEKSTKSTKNVRYNMNLALAPVPPRRDKTR